MTKSQLVDEIHKKRNSNFTKQQVAAVIDDVFDLIKNSLSKGERVEIRNFGNFSLRKREARKARNPKTGEIANVPAKRVPFFKAGKELKEMVDAD
jgi:integration host factor subunit beta